MQNPKDAFTPIESKSEICMSFFPLILFTFLRSLPLGVSKPLKTHSRRKKAKAISIKNVSVRVYSHQAKAKKITEQAKKIKEQAKEIKEKKFKPQGKFSLSIIYGSV